MKILTKVTGILLIPIVAAILIIWSYYLAILEYESFIKSEGQVDNLILRLNRLEVLTAEFNNYKYQRIILQWYGIHDSAKEAIASLQLAAEQDKTLIKKIKEKNIIIKELFEKINSLQGKGILTEPHLSIAHEREKRLSGQLRANISQIYSSLVRLRTFKRNSVVLQQDYIFNIILYGMIALFIIVVVVILLIRESISKPINRLVSATKELANGNLEHSIEVTSMDELGELSQEFNLMGSMLLSSDKKVKDTLKTIKDSEKQLRESENKLYAVMENAYSVIYLKDMEGRYILVNKPFEQILGKSRKDIIDKTDNDLFPEDAANVFIESDKQVFENKKTIETEDEIYDSNNNKHFYLSVKFPLINEEGEVSALCGFATDITAQRQVQHELELLNDELEQRVKRRTSELSMLNKDLQAFAYTIAHDLSTPLRGIDGFSKALLMEYNDIFDEEAKHYLSRIRKSTLHMGDIIQALLKLNKITINELSIDRINLSELSKDILSDIKLAEPERDVSIIIEPELNVYADKKLILLFLDNVLDNAWKYTSKVKDAKIEIGVEKQQEQLVYYVRDNGCGFDMAYVDKLFMPFNRLHSTKDYRGTGIGLTTAAKVIQRHMGRVWAESEVDKGTTIFFTIPDREATNEL